MIFYCFLLFFVVTFADVTLQKSDASNTSIFVLAYPRCHDLNIYEPYESYLFDTNRKFGQYLDDESKTHLLWGDYGSTDQAYDVLVDNEPFVDNEFDPMIGFAYSAQSIIEIFDLDGNGIPELLATTNTYYDSEGPLVILYRDANFSIIDSEVILKSQWLETFDDQYDYASLSMYVDVGGVDTNPEILFSFGSYYFRGAWIISINGSLQEYIKISSAVGASEIQYGMSISMWHNFSNTYPDIVVGDPTSDGVIDGSVHRYTVSNFNFNLHTVDYEEDLILFNNEQDSLSGFGNSVSLIHTSGSYPKLAVGSSYQNYFVIITSSDSTSVDSFEYYTRDQLLSRNSDGFGRSVMQIQNLNDGGSIGEIIVGDQDGFCLFFLDDGDDYPIDILTAVPVFETTTQEATTEETTMTTTIEEFTTSTYEDLITTTFENDLSTLDILATTTYDETASNQLSPETSVMEVQSTTTESVTTEEPICTIVQGSCDDDGGQVIIKPPTNTSNGVNITVDVTINNNATITGSNVSITGTISITGSLDLDSSSLDIKNKVDIGGDLNVGNSVLIFSKGGGIKTDGCVNFASDSEIKIDITDEEKKELAKSGEGFVLIESDCFEGEEKFTDSSSTCEKGVKESIKVDDDKMSVIFESCVDPIIIVVIACIVVGVILAVVMIVFLTPVKKVVFPHRYQDREGKRDTVMRDSRILDRLTVMDTELREIHNRTSNLKHELENLDTDSE